MKIDRSKFKATKVATLKEQKEQASQSNRTEYISLKDGKNLVRIYPAHPGTSAFAVQKSVAWLPKFVTDDDGQKEWKRRPIFNAEVHGQKGQKDLVLAYIEFTKKHVQENFPASEAKKKIDALYHFKTGCYPSRKWVLYAEVDNLDGKSFGILEVGNGIKSQLDKLAIDQEEDGMDADPFTDPDDGMVVKIMVDKKASKPQDYYSVGFDIKGNKVNTQSLTDEDLESFAEIESLEKKYVNSFKASDFKLQLEGLQRYDEENEIGTFEYDNWFDIVEKIAAQFPEEDYSDDDLPMDTDEGKEHIKATHKKMESRKNIKNVTQEEESQEEEEDQNPEPEKEETQEAEPAQNDIAARLAKFRKSIKK